MKLHLKNNNEFSLQTRQIESIFTDIFYAKEIRFIDNPISKRNKTIL